MKARMDRLYVPGVRGVILLETFYSPVITARFQSKIATTKSTK
jgi:hypothetical protein